MEVNISVNSNISKHGCAQIKINAGRYTSYVDLDLKTLKSKLVSLNELSLDFLVISSSIYVIDKLVPRAETKDSWTREFEVSIPVHNSRKWNSVKVELSNCVSFLTGDNWHFTFTKLKQDLDQTSAKLKLNPIPNPSAVCLFSGGVDSLVGAIDWLEKNKDLKLCLVSHYDGHIKGPRTDQLLLIEDLKRTYPDRISHIQVRAGQFPTGNETTFRARSILFLALATAVAAKSENQIDILIPENGTIALNIPLTASRRGSCSTRTAHPSYLNQLNEILFSVGLPANIKNPYKMKTKGEVVNECLNTKLLKNIVAKTCSCAKRGHKRTWVNRTATSCGRCMPCIYRRAALHTLKIDKETYGRDICTGEVNVQDEGELQNDLRAFFAFCSKNMDKKSISKNLLSNGSLPIEELDLHSDTVARAFAEIKKWLAQKATKDIKKRAKC